MVPRYPNQDRDCFMILSNNIIIYYVDTITPINSIADNLIKISIIIGTLKFQQNPYQ